MSDLPTNYLGAAIFWSYILAALAFSGIAIHTILKINPTTTRLRSHDDAKLHARSLRLFTLLATLSFATLSTNMLHVLIHSFHHWHSALPLPHSHPHSPGQPAPPTTWPSLIWHWSTTSALFQDFAHAILATPARRIWTFGELGMAMAVCLHMGQEGRRRRVPRLYAFFALSQILPVSFAQDLFYLAVLRMDGGGVEAKGGSGSEGYVRDGDGGEKGVVVIPAAWVNVTCLAYGACIVAAACLLNETGLLMPLVLLARLLLLVPRFLPLRLQGENQEKGGWARTALPLIALVMVGYASVTAFLDDDHGLSIPRALFSHPAVSSLGCDAVLSLISLALWKKIGAQAENTERLREKSR
ncbi:hypothetical protein KC347_g8470 [Hortaea werneckii]|nr:hypothetical protein KC347_g8470 [Hortaea werneckii]